MKREELKAILQNAYTQEKWIKTLQFLSGSKNLLTISLEPKAIEIKSAKAKEIVSEIVQLGSLKTTDGIMLPIFDVTLQDGIKIEYNRVGVNDLLKNHILKDAIKGAIVTFHYGEKYNKDEWRFSFISKFGSDYFAEAESVQTNPKKYTYIFGTSEEHRTALERLYNLEQSRFRLEDFFEAFNVEPVSNNFFKEYKNFYQDFVFHISNDKKSRAIFEQEKTDDVEKDIRNFVKRLLGRLVFLYFLQKKHWLGASNKKYVDGDTNFLYNLFKYNEQSEEHFYSKWLSNLFFNALNSPNRENDYFLLPSGKKVCVPFLNGGLFEEGQEPINHREISISSYLFEELFIFFNSYNFTIYENSPEDHTVAVDPEMLGHIFENLLEDNKDKGAFYTPKEIVHYMTQESLIEYLKTHLSHSREAIENLIKKHITTDFNKEEIKKVEKLIDTVKICDPAIGSGAFPMGLLQEISGLKAVFHFALDKKPEDWKPAAVKQAIIQNSIYGVDLENDAVDIARLRFWLSLVVDEPTPKPLPNLDYKIMQGNSLLESFEGVDLSKVTYENNLVIVENQDRDLFGNLSDDQLKITYGKTGLAEKIQKLVNEYFDASVTKKPKIKSEINIAIKEHIDFNLELRENQFIRLINDIKSIKNPNSKEIKSLERLENDFLNLNDVKINLEIIQTKEEKPYFLWHLFFADVFKDKGFDIVIGNPPYIQLQKMGKVADLLQNEGYETFRRTGDIYTLFYEKANMILKPSGILSYITSNTWMRTKSGDGLRNYFVTQTNIINLLNFEDTQIFPSATVEVNILLSKKETWDNQIRATAIKGDYRKGTNIADYEKINHIVLNEVSNDSWVILDATSTKIKSQIENFGIPLSLWNEGKWKVDFYRGFLTGFNDAFFIDEDTKNKIIAQEPQAVKIIKPLLRGREIKKYNYVFTNNYVIFPHNGLKKKDNEIPRIDINDYPIVKKHLEQEKYWEHVEKRSDQGDTPYNLRNCAYLEVFDNEKIVWLSISDKPAFALDNSNMYVTAPAYIMTSQCNKYLLALLNSKTMEWYLDKVSSSTGQGTNQWSKIFVEQLPIPQIEDYRKELLENLVIFINYLKDKKTTAINDTVKNEHIANFFEDVIDGCVFELYFEEHMKEKGINIITDVRNFIENSSLTNDFENINEDIKKQKIWELYKNLKDSLVQQKMRMFVVKSPDILKPILQS